MNEGKKVVTVEKKAANKVGLVLLMLFVLAGLGFGAYYYITNKNLIAFEFKLPWEKEEEEEEKEEEETIVVDGKTISKKIKTERTLERDKVEVTTDDPFYESDGSSLFVTNVDLKDGAYIVRLKLVNNSIDNCVIKTKAVIVDGFQLGQTFTIQAAAGGEATYDLVLSAQELDKNRIETITEVKLIVDYIHMGETNEKNILIRFNDNAYKSNITTIASIGVINSFVKIEYYKKVETSKSTKLYFLFTNNSEEKYNYYIERLAVNDKDVETSQYKDTIYGGTSYISVIELPKKLLSQNKKIKISFIFQSENKSVYKTVEKELKL